ncbi:hypothetical protein JMJ35_010573 [Cladonia borealis]|uniref:Glucose-methanol-choline oxidoreductase N-terminal domain-containing protein n=1 Tax=Cladonia borealis TaxID=184061 RepID=A0AA39QQ75_9LECA|nr:hypothetical protein JMJ35_010573 [Cladonia borealis]
MILQCIAAWPATHVTETNEQSYRVKPARATVTSAPPSQDFPKYLAWQTPHLRTTGYDRNSLGVAKYTSADYDHWAELVGDNSWSWENSLKRFNKIRTLRHPAQNFENFVSVSTAAHGKDGYPVEHLRHTLPSAPPNLTMVTETTITKILIQGKKAVGVEAYGKHWYARQEIVLAAGAIDSPKLLLLSGIGPAKDLQELSIPLVQDLPGVGKNLQDRLFVELVTVQDPWGHHQTSYIDWPAALEQARKQWLTSQSGYQLLSASDVIISQKRQYFFLARVQRLGHDHALIDPNFLAHPFDKRVAIESVRETLEFLGKPLMATSTVHLAAGPSGNTDEDILAYMGKIDEQGTCVDKDFKASGMQNLKVVDMSVAPFLPSAHLHAVAYLVGETAAEKIIAEYH